MFAEEIQLAWISETDSTFGWSKKLVLDWLERVAIPIHRLPTPPPAPSTDV
jgi:hypothetical protein